METLQQLVGVLFYTGIAALIIMAGSFIYGLVIERKEKNKKC
jgi:hypothetical protein